MWCFRLGSTLRNYCIINVSDKNYKNYITISGINILVKYIFSRIDIYSFLKSN